MIKTIFITKKVFEIEISKPSLTRALVSTDSKGVTSLGRTGSNTWIKHDHDEITKEVGERIAKIVLVWKLFLPVSALIVL